MNINKFKKIILGVGYLAILAVIVLPSTQALAADTDSKGYKLLAPLPGLSETLEEDNILGTYVPTIFSLAIGLAAVFAVLMIVLGGIQYMSADAFQGKEDGKKRAENAVKGLLFVIAAWLILNEINPNLLEFDLNITPATVEAPAGAAVTPGLPMTASEIIASNNIRNSLQQKGVGTYRGPCEQGQTTGCVNLDGLTVSTQSGLADLATEFGAFLNKPLTSEDPVLEITGATEDGHSMTGNHPKGRAVDFSFQYNSQLTSYVESKGVTPVPTSDGDLYTIEINGSNVEFLKEDNHWHVAFP